MEKKWNPDGDQAWMDQIASFNFTSIHNAIPDELFRHLVISRSTSTSSKLKTVRYLQQYKNLDYNVLDSYRDLDKLVVHQREIVEQISYDHTLKILSGTMSVVFYDVTTIYFEAEKEDDLRVAGFSKDGFYGLRFVIVFKIKVSIP